MPGDIDPFETGKAAHPDVVELREQERVDEMSAIDRELRVIDCLFGDLQSRRTRAKKSAAASPIEFGLRLLGARHEVGQIKTKQVVTLDHIRIAFLNNAGQAFERVSLRFFHILWIDQDQFLPARVVGQRDAHDMVTVATALWAVIRDAPRLGAGRFKRQHLQLQSFQFFERQILEQRSPGRGEIMLNRIG